MPERIGVLGGTFDPIHVGHLVAAVNARHALDLDRVILMVANLAVAEGRSPGGDVGRGPPGPGRGGGGRRRPASRQAGSRSTGGASPTPPTPWTSWHGCIPGAELYLIVGWDVADGADHAGTAGRTSSAWPPSSWSTGPGPGGRVARRAVAGRGGDRARPGDLQHRPAGPGRRRPAARLSGAGSSRALPTGPGSVRY